MAYSTYPNHFLFFSMKLNIHQQKQFRETYRVLYRDETELLRDMKRFDPKDQLMPDVSRTEGRRALVDRLRSGNKRETDPYRTSLDFHFSDIKYFLGDGSIDLFVYGVPFTPLNLTECKDSRRVVLNVFS